MTPNNEEEKNEGNNTGETTTNTGIGAVTPDGSIDTTVNTETTSNEGESNKGENVAEADNSVANYRMLHPTNRKDASGTEQTVPAGAIVELPVTYGDSLVAQGQAELVETEEVVE